MNEPSCVFTRLCLRPMMLLRLLLLATALPLASAPAAAQNAGFVMTNSLGMELVPMPGVDVLFCRWETRVQDFSAFMRENYACRVTGMWGQKYFPREGGSVAWRQDVSWDDPGFPQGPSNPVCGVGGKDAEAFCRWLTDREQAMGLLTPYKFYRLPTWPEWRVATGFPTTGNVYALEGELGNYCGPEGLNKVCRACPCPGFAVRANYYGGVTAKRPDGTWKINDPYPWSSPVGSFPANRFGLYDMGGNVMEMLRDGPDMPAEEYAVSAGYSWDSNDESGNLPWRWHPREIDNPPKPPCLPSKDRTPGAPYRVLDVGFRCVLAELTAGNGGIRSQPTVTNMFRGPLNPLH